MGKTALACKVLQDLERHRWPYTDHELPIDGIVYLSTRTAGISLERLFLDCAKLLGGEEQERLNAVWTNPQLETEQKVTRLLDALHDGRYVILLDNLEDLLDDRGQLTDDDLRLFFERALMGARGAQLMVTSRVALAFRREVMRFDQQVKLLEGLPTEEGVALLRELDPNGDYGLRDASEEQLAQAVELTHGVPRALEVLAGILANDPFATLDEVVETFYEQEDVVQALIEENYQRLDRDARRVIEALAVFRKPVPPLAVDYLLEPFAPGLDVPGVVQRLTRTNIVSVDRAAKTVALHPIDQDYAYSQLPKEEIEILARSRKALEQRAADYYAHLQVLPESWHAIDDLEPQLLQFRHLVNAHAYDQAALLMNEIDEGALSKWGYYQRIKNMRGALVGKIQDLTLAGQNLGWLGHAVNKTGAHLEAVGYLEEALAIAQRANNEYDEMMWMANLAWGIRHLQPFEESHQEAIRYFQKAINLAQELGNPRYISFWLSELGHTLRNLGDFSASTKMFQLSLDLARHKNDFLGILTALRHLGITFRLTGQQSESTQALHKALKIAESIDDTHSRCLVLINLGQTYDDMGRHNIALQYFDQALPISKQLSVFTDECWCYISRVRSYLRMRQYNKASEEIDLALRVANQVSIPQLLQALSPLYAELVFRNGELESATQIIAANLQNGMPEYLHRTLLLYGFFLILQDKHSQAKGALEYSIAIAQDVLRKEYRLYEARYSQALAFVALSLISSGSHKGTLLQRALDEFEKGLKTCNSLGVTNEILRLLTILPDCGFEPIYTTFNRNTCE
jgi:tetratricopeptide (TPR) repeat protein